MRAAPFIVAILLGASLLFSGGCRHSQRPATTRKSALASEPAWPASPPATRPLGKADLPLDAILPVPRLGAAVPSTRPTERAPLKAIELYAKALYAMAENRRFEAINLLEEAVRLDGESFELNYALGEAYAGAGNMADRAITAYEKAAALRPDHLRLQLELGRLYLARGEGIEAIHRLRLAMQTTDYQADDDAGALAELLLARALEQQGYDRAALDISSLLLARLIRNPPDPRTHPDLAILLGRTEAAFAAVGELYEKRGDLNSALSAFEEASRRRPENIGYAARAARLLVKLGRQSEAATRAAETVARFRGSPESLALLREIYRDAGRGDDAMLPVELEKLAAQQPDNRGVLYALVEVMESRGRRADAERLLTRETARLDFDPELVRRLVGLQLAAADTAAAARTLVQALARRPDTLRELAPVWTQLLRPSRKHRLRLPDIQRLDVAPEAQASKLFWLSRTAQALNRDALARSTLEEAAAITPPFPPAMRFLLGSYWSRDDWDEARKAAATEVLIERATAQGNPGLAAELRANALVGRGRYREAVAEFDRAAALGGGASPDLLLAQAAALRQSGEPTRAEQILWRLLADRPTCEDAYSALFQYYVDNGVAPQAMRVLRQWLSADPGNVNARLLEATIYIRAGQAANAERILLELLDGNADNGELIELLSAVFIRTNRTGELIERLEAERRRNPENRIAVEQIVNLYARQNRNADAIRVLDETRLAVADDPDLLYYVAHLYGRVGQEGTTERILADVVALDPGHAPASNDLGYSWADRGTNLDRAESLIRVAVEAEPDNQSFLDSLGWVLYKRGKFAEAVEYLRRAIEPATYPDPVVLDHLGDALYQLGRTREAFEQWERSRERLGAGGDEEREDLRRLRLEIGRKIEQSKAGKPVQVAPFVGNAAGPATQRQQARQ